MKKSVLVLGIGVIAIGGLLTGCGTTAGSSTSAASTGTSKVPASVLALAKSAGEAQPWTGPTTSPALAKNKFIVSIPCSLSAAGCARIDTGVKAAAAAAGWREQTIDPANDVSQMSAAIHQAISLGANGIALNSIEPALVASAVADARKAGLSVVNANAGREDNPVTATSVQHDVSLHGPLEGNIIGALICKDSNGTANVMTVIDEQYHLLVQRIAGEAAEFKKCPGIKNQVQQISVNDLGTVLQTKIKALLAANPDVNTVTVPSDAFTPDVETAIQQAGLANKVKVYSMDGNAQVVANIQSGGPSVADVGGALDEEGWAMVDNLNRLFQGSKTVDDGTPIRVVSKSFIPAGGQYDGDVNYVAKYKQLWSTGKTSK